MCWLQVPQSVTTLAFNRKPPSDPNETGTSAGSRNIEPALQQQVSADTVSVRRQAKQLPAIEAEIDGSLP
jgi:hypothetical protein